MDDRRQLEDRLVSRVLAEYLAITQPAAAALAARMSRHERGEVLCARLLYDASARREVARIAREVQRRSDGQSPSPAETAPAETAPAETAPAETAPTETAAAAAAPKEAAPQAAGARDEAARQRRPPAGAIGRRRPPAQEQPLLF